MVRFLFVDDEPNLLDGLNRSLRPMRHAWRMTFVTSGVEALKLLEQEPFDVVVSDMRMPGMDGPRLLSEVRRRHPQIIRIVLSGQSDQEKVYQSIGATHQYLAKPCKSEMLKAAVRRACAMREYLGNDSLRRMVGEIQRLPSHPTRYVELREAVESKTASLKAVGAIMSKDMAMTAKILQLVNSAYFGLRHTVSTVEQAVSLLGLDTVQALVLTVEVFSRVDSMCRSSRVTMDRLWESSLEVGRLARAIAKAEQASALVIDEAYTAGLLHNVGMLVLAVNVPTRYDAVLTTAYDRGISLREAERQEFGATHADVGASLLSLWGLSGAIVEAVAFHHHPSDCVGDTFSPLTAVHAASALRQDLFRQATEDIPSRIDVAYLDRLHMTDRLPHWREAAYAVQRAAEQEKSNGRPDSPHE